MNIVYYLLCLALLCFNVNSAQAFVDSSLSSDFIGYDDSFLSRVKSNSFLDISSNLPQDNIKLAAVHLITSPDRLKVVRQKTDVPKCDVNSYPLSSTSTGILNCETYDTCNEGVVEKRGCTSCKNNMTLSNGKCSCDRTVYNYDTTNNPCPTNSQPSQEADDICQETGADGSVKTYYAKCLCPDDFQYECTDTGQVGALASCTANGVTKYVSCRCNEEYNLTCSGTSTGTGTVSAPPTGNDKCIDLVQGVTYYRTCSTICANGYYATVADWWNQCWCGADEEMVAFKVNVNDSRAEALTYTIGADGDATIDWGDGTVTNTIGSTKNYAHEYSEEGTYTIKITGVPTEINGSYYYCHDSLVEVVKVNLPSVISYNQLFQEANNMTGNLSNVTLHEGLENTDEMFENTNVSGTPPALPSTVTSANRMYYGVNNLDCCTAPSGISATDYCPRLVLVQCVLHEVGSLDDTILVGPVDGSLVENPDAGDIIDGSTKDDGGIE